MEGNTTNLLSYSEIINKLKCTEGEVIVSTNQTR